MHPEEKDDDECFEDWHTPTKIVKNSNPVWTELFEMQKMADGQTFCDVHIIGNNGYVPCHRLVLLEKSIFLTELITDDKQANWQCSCQISSNNPISISIDVDANILKHVVTLFYTGYCIVANMNEAKEVTDVLSLLRIDLKNATILDAGSTNTIKIKTNTSARVCDPVDFEHQYIRRAPAPRENAASPHQKVAGIPNEGILHSSLANDGVAKPSITLVSSSHVTEENDSTHQNRSNGNNNDNASSARDELREERDDRMGSVGQVVPAGSSNAGKIIGCKDPPLRYPKRTRPAEGYYANKLTRKKNKVALHGIHKKHIKTVNSPKRSVMNVNMSNRTLCIQAKANCSNKVTSTSFSLVRRLPVELSKQGLVPGLSPPKTNYNIANLKHWRDIKIRAYRLSVKDIQLIQQDFCQGINVTLLRPPCEHGYNNLVSDVEFDVGVKVKGVTYLYQPEAIPYPVKHIHQPLVKTSKPNTTIELISSNKAISSNEASSKSQPNSPRETISTSQAIRTCHSQSKNESYTNIEFRTESRRRLTSKSSEVNQIRYNIQERTIVTADGPSSIQQIEERASPLVATYVDAGSVALTSTDSIVEPKLKKKLHTERPGLNSPKNTTNFDGVTITDVHGRNEQVEKPKTVSCRSEAAENVVKTWSNVHSHTSSTENATRNHTAGASYDFSIDQLLYSIDNYSPRDTSNVTGYNQQRNSFIWPSRCRTPAHENQITRTSIQKHQHLQPTSIPVLNIHADKGKDSNRDTRHGSRSAISDIASTTHDPSLIYGNQDVHTLVPMQRSTLGYTVDGFQQVQHNRLPVQEQGQQLRGQIVGKRSQQYQPLVSSFERAIPTFSSRKKQLTQTTKYPVGKSSVVGVSHFHITGQPAVTITNNIDDQLAVPATSNVSFQLEGDLEVRSEKYQKLSAQSKVRTVSHAKRYTKQYYEQQQPQKFQYSPQPCKMNVHKPNWPYLTQKHAAALLTKSNKPCTSSARHTPILNNAQRLGPIDCDVSIQGYKKITQQSGQTYNTTHPQHLQAIHAQYFTQNTTPTQNQAHPILTGVSTLGLYVPPVYTHAATSISPKVPVPNEVPQTDQLLKFYKQTFPLPVPFPSSHYPSASSTSSVTYQEHQPNQNGDPLKGSINFGHDDIINNRVAVTSRKESSASGRTSVAPNMNTLVNNNSGHQVEQQAHRFQMHDSTTNINYIKLLATTETISSNISSGRESWRERGRVACEACGNIFGSLLSYINHKKDGPCQ